MTALIIVGAQWGDEGKGKLTDYLAREAQWVVRFQGGANAGHTLKVGDQVIKLHLVPSGILRPGVGCLIGNGVVLDVEALLKELDGLEAAGISTAALRIARGAHLLLPTHRFLDAAAERRRGANAIGTTGRGIGPAYLDKVGRYGIRAEALEDAEGLVLAVKRHFEEHGALLEGSGLTQEALRDKLTSAASRLRPFLVDGPDLVNEALDAGKQVLLEGAQGTLLDIDHGTYPFVTSSSAVAGGACTGSGVGPMRIGAVVGVTKAYTTRVGAGPFPTELHGAEGEALRERGGEYGTTTGRPRRCGWLDLVALKRAVRLNGLSHLAMTKLDVLGNGADVRLCVGYSVQGALREDFPSGAVGLARVTPVYETMPGWSLKELPSDFEGLPSAAKAYVARVEAFTKVPVALLGLGAERSQTLVREDLWAFARSRHAIRQ